ncbi:MAG: DUF3237 domain-containing protein [Thermoleophilia bacterium]
MTEHPSLEFAFEARVEVGPEELIGHGEGDALHFTPIIGGTVMGPRLRGIVVPGGGDWYVKRGPTTIQLDARYLIRADDDALIDVVNRGYYRTKSAEVMRRADRGEPVAAEDLYYRTSPVFRTGAPAHRWLAESVFVGMAREESGQVCIRFYEVM